MRGALPLLWLACTPSAFAAVDPTTLVVAAVFPMFYPDGIKSLPGTRALAAFLLAIEEINNKTDGIHDELLPNSVIEVAYADSKCEVRATLTGLIQLLSLQGGEWGGMSGIVGSWCSSSTIALANMATVLSIPQISFGAMSDDLSDRVRYPFFMRTAPSLVDECYAIVDVLRYLFIYSRVAVIYSNEEYGVSSNSAFRVAAQRAVNGVQLQILQNIRIRMPVGQTLPTYAEEYETLLKAGARVIVLLGQAAAARPFIYGGLAFGIGGDGFVWMGNAGMTDDAIYSAGVMSSISPKHRLRLMKGFFGLHPSLAAHTPAANRVLSHLRANRREGNGTLCDLATDRYGTRLFAADVDGDGALECAGWQENETTSTGDYWAASAYDAAYALAFGLDDLRRQAVDGGEAFASLASRGAEVFEAVVNSEVFEGASGEVSFYNDSVSTWYGPGDRTSEGQLFALMNYADNEHGLVQVGTVKSCTTCTWESRFSYGPAKLTFSTSDNTKPLDVPEPKPTYDDERGSGDNSTLLCDETCDFSSDGGCDDGGDGSTFDLCGLGTDCTDCGARGDGGIWPPSAPPPPCGCNDACPWSFDSVCDDGGEGSDFSTCVYATDCADCGDRCPLPPPSPPAPLPAVVVYSPPAQPPPPGSPALVVALVVVGVLLVFFICAALAIRRVLRRIGLSPQMLLRQWSHHARINKLLRLPVVRHLAWHISGWHITDPRTLTLLQVLQATFASVLVVDFAHMCYQDSDVPREVLVSFAALACIVFLLLAAQFMFTTRAVNQANPSAMLVAYIISTVHVVGTITLLAYCRESNRSTRWLLSNGASVTVFLLAALSWLAYVVVAWNVAFDFQWRITIKAGSEPTKRSIYRRMLAFRAALEMDFLGCICNLLVVAFLWWYTEGHGEELPQLVGATAVAASSFVYDVAILRTVRRGKVWHAHTLALFGVLQISFLAYFAAYAYLGAVGRWTAASNSSLWAAMSREVRHEAQYHQRAVKGCFVMHAAVALLALYARSALVRASNILVHAISQLAPHMSSFFTAQGWDVRRPSEGLPAGYQEMKLRLFERLALQHLADGEVLSLRSIQPDVEKSQRVDNDHRYVQLSLELGILRWSAKGYVALDQVVDLMLIKRRRAAVSLAGDRRPSNGPLVTVEVEEAGRLGEDSQNRNSQDEDSMEPVTAISTKAESHWLKIRYIKGTKVCELHLGSPSRESIQQWHVGLRIAIDKLSSPRACSTLLQWIRDMFTAIDKRSEGAVPLSKIDWLLAAANTAADAQWQMERALEDAGCDTATLRESSDDWILKALSPSHVRGCELSMLMVQRLFFRLWQGSAIVRLFESYADEISCKEQTIVRGGGEQRSSSSQTKIRSFARRRIRAAPSRAIAKTLKRIRRGSGEISTTDEPLMDLDEWLRFQAEEQGDDDVEKLKEVFNKATTWPNLRSTRMSGSMLQNGTNEPMLNAFNFQLLMLSKENSAICPSRIAPAPGEFDLPMSHYWISCSHNTYAEVDQLAGISSDAMYRRVLLQGCRSIEVDAWDGESGEPEVTHGHTLCSRVKLDLVLKAIAETAFINSNLPVSISLEVHCSLEQQRRMVELLEQYLGDRILRAEECPLPPEQVFSPAQLAGRFILKGKVEPVVLPGVAGGKKFPRRPSCDRSEQSFGRHSIRRISKPEVRARRCTPASMVQCGRVPVSAAVSSSRASEAGAVDEPASPHSSTVADNLVPPSRCSSGNSEQLVQQTAGTTLGALELRLQREEACAAAAEEAEAEAEEESEVERSMLLSRALDHVFAQRKDAKELQQRKRNTFSRLRLAGSKRTYHKDLLERRVISKGKDNNGYAINEKLNHRRHSFHGLFPVFGNSELRQSAVNNNQAKQKGRPVHPSLVPLLTLRSCTIVNFMKQAELQWPYPVTSMEERKVEAQAETDELTASMQERTMHRMLRVFPRGGRADSSNLDPLPSWRCGAQLIALNMQTNDLPVQLHHALFELSGGLGYVPKPIEMRRIAPMWPPPRQQLTRVSIRLISLHQLPAGNQARPDVHVGRHSECHEHASHLSGRSILPKSQTDPASPSLQLELHAIGGFSCVSEELPVPERTISNTVFRTAEVQRNGLNPHFDQLVHCLAQEPRETILKLAVWDAEKEIAYETAVLGVLRQGYRCFHLRSSRYGTRIEMCKVFVHIAFGVEPHEWAKAKELRQQIRTQQDVINAQRETIRHQENLLASRDDQLKQLLASISQLPLEIQLPARMEQDDLQHSQTFSQDSSSSKQVGTSPNRSAERESSVGSPVKSVRFSRQAVPECCSEDDGAVGPKC